MTEHRADFVVEEQTGSSALLGVLGSLTNAAEADLMAAVNELAGQGVHTIILDFSEMAYMSSTGIGLLVTLLVRAKRLDLQLAACGLNEHYREIFAMTRLEDAFEVFDTREAALASV